MIATVTFISEHGVTVLTAKVIDQTERFIVLGSQGFYAEVPTEAVLEMAEVAS